MKFGEHLIANKNKEWEDQYLAYDKLDVMISDLEQKHVGGSLNTGKGTSLSVPRPTNAAGMPMDDTLSQEQFFLFLEQEMRKIEEFTNKQVKEIRKVLGTVTDSNVSQETRQRVDEAAENFLKLEKYVNLNFTGFHKILKKHDRHLPNPCKAFYLSRLHDQSWVRGDYSDILVTMSRVYSILRGDAEGVKKDDETQNFIRSTTKYWVHTENISRVKYIVLQHLPVFLQSTMQGETDSQLVNSTYVDNAAMELYHGRLDKTPGAIALRMRWYGTGKPELVFVERKTHRESWTGEVSVKERFIIQESQVNSLMAGTFDKEAEIKRMRSKGKKEEDIKEWDLLATEVIQAINSKQLVPTMRTQYMRTAFQIPFDATVRISLDTNLCMINERTEDTMQGLRWYRDPTVKVPLNEITRFPHAVLEVKLQIDEGGHTPEWVKDLIESGMLMEVHKFSKFIHGCAVLLPEEVRAVPYWIDDSTLADSIAQSGAGKLLQATSGANEHYQHLLPHDKNGNAKPKVVLRRTPGEGDFALEVSPSLTGENCYEDFVCCEWATEMEDGESIRGQKAEPKLYFANERTFIKWLHMAVILSSISIGVLAFSGKEGLSQTYAVMMLPLALLFVVYALVTFLWRSNMMRNRDSARWDDPFGPVLLTVLLIIALTIQFFMKLSQILSESNAVKTQGR